jgi:hypothetical protein
VDENWWMNCLSLSSALTDDQSRYDEFRALNTAARDTWATVSFEDWLRHLKHCGSQMYWGDFVALRDKALEKGR